MSTANLNVEQPGPLLDALTRMNNVAPMNWWRFMPCATCYASRGVDCAAHRPHSARVRAGTKLHATLWLLTNGYADDVLGTPPEATGADLRAAQTSGEGMGADGGAGL